MPEGFCDDGRAVDQTSPPTFQGTVYTLTPLGAVVNIDMIFSVQADNEGQATLSFHVDGIACGHNQPFAADRTSNNILVYPFSCPGEMELTIDGLPGERKLKKAR